MVCRSAVCASDPVRVPQSPVEEGQLAQLGAAKVVLLKKKRRTDMISRFPYTLSFS